MLQQRPRVVVVGGGFAGLWAAKEMKGAPVEVTVIDRNNFHTFFPLLYQVASAELQPGDIVHPIRAILRHQDNATFRLGDVTRIDPDRKMVVTPDDEVPYDHLLVGIGSTTAWFGVAGASDHAFGLRTLDEAIRLRNHLLRRVETAHRLDDPEARRRELTFVVVGGGPTGVEFAGALQELINGPLAKDHVGLDLGVTRTILVEAGPRLLSTFPESLSEYAHRRLTRMGVEVRTASTVVAVDDAGLDLGGHERIDASTVVWAAGVAGGDAPASWGLPTGRGGRVEILPTLQVAAYPDVWVAGDLALPEQPAPMVAQNAIQQGRLAARNIVRAIEGVPLEEYRYRDYGTMAVIGRNAAVAHFGGRWRFKGYFAWLMWLGLHLVKLIGFRNRVAALMSWTGDYLFRDRVARLIIGR